MHGERAGLEPITGSLMALPPTRTEQGPGSILSVESNQNMESKTKNVESKTEKCGVQNSIFTSRNQLF